MADGDSVLWNGLVKNLLFLYMWRQKWLCQHSFLSVTNTGGTFKDPFCHCEADWEEAHLCYSTFHLGGNLHVWFLSFDSAKPSSARHSCVTGTLWGLQVLARCGLAVLGHARLPEGGPSIHLTSALCLGKWDILEWAATCQSQVMRKWGNSFCHAGFLK